ncbi:unnamed protein product [Chondrus crispus]|uniref:Uncharacterized protein n=1 Tax=Chondrus crispus TaxID=2769 RepID=R7Q2Q1_CHOCR|nr:unnamed protein product [Chondrus crispus]CDF32852.1 unnamed protein product [Chondrus crispus]|eukprot:XP_005712653.1 unnamed protein product [Chondrus crispus]
MELLEEFSSLLQSPPSPHLTDFIQITISVIAFATCAGDPFPVQPSTIYRIRRLRQSLSTTPHLTKLICQDLDTLTTRWSAAPC